MKLKDFVDRRTIKFQLIITLIFTSLFPAIIISAFYYIKMNNFIENKVEFYQRQITMQAGEKMDFIIKQVEIAKEQLIGIAVTSELFDGYSEKSPLEKVLVFRKTDEMLYNLKSSNPIINDLFLIGLDGHVYSSNRNCNTDMLISKNWIKELSDSQYAEKVLPSHSVDYDYLIPRELSEPVISFLKKITGIGNNSAIGIVQVDLKYSELKKVVNSMELNEKGSVIILGPGSSPLYISNKSDITCDEKGVYFKGLNILGEDGVINVSKSGKYLVTSYSSDNKYKIMGITPMDSLYIEINQVKNLFIIILILSLFFSLLITYILSKKLLHPVNILISNMKKAGQGDFNVNVPDLGYNDLQILSDSFNKMIVKIDGLMKKSIKEEKEKLYAVLKSLQSQINSHFLYNTLNTIKWMAIMEKSDRIANAIVALVKILEYSCKSLDKLVRISDEVEFIKNYVLIQHLRYGNNISLCYVIPDNILNCYILKVTLQPIIENAFIHAFSENAENAVITVGAREMGDRIQLIVKDNGKGMDIRRKDQLSGMGIANVDERIKLNFGNEYGLCVSSEKSKGTEVVLTIPKIVTGGDADV